MVSAANQKSIIYIQKRKWNPNITLKTVIKSQENKRVKGEETYKNKRKDLQKQIQHNKQNGSKNIHIDNYHKCKQIKYSNQKT